MFGSFGCRDDFRGCHFDNDCKKDDFRKDDFRKDDFNKKSLCNVLFNISIGTKISLLKIKDHGTFRDVIFEGFSCGVALFSNQDHKHDWDDEDENWHKDKFRGLLRVCPEDIIAIAV
ncbi:DUF3915 family protein [Bacillus gaemokensis]|uniref:DUF3915 domain-containing protein n=1 Tax=Bacillus gaemokensis TaxID=574375 RepID=A0A073KHP3_9BACI|nr:DUF3915 family protein [Bacillus gaemokensis]KEK25981.1 hypothetical protein BAGA_01730 [Bacillus gaemokensis]KYG38795.1 hypothetical protein AZF08_01805 [Bacillus gaemokensis]